MDPWDDFPNATRVNVVDAEGGGFAIVTQSPLGWCFWLSKLARLTHNREALEGLARGLNESVEQGVRLETDGWEVVGAEKGSPAANFLTHTETTDEAAHKRRVQ